VPESEALTIAMTDALNLDFRDLLQCLSSEGAEFLIVGAYAVAFHGTPRAIFLPEP
jgi:hypothetical protein